MAGREYFRLTSVRPTACCTSAAGLGCGVWICENPVRPQHNENNNNDRRFILSELMVPVKLLIMKSAIC
jgi:hypothetical protein